MTVQSVAGVAVKPKRRKGIWKKLKSKLRNNDRNNTAEDSQFLLIEDSSRHNIDISTNNNNKKKTEKKVHFERQAHRHHKKEAKTSKRDACSDHQQKTCKDEKRVHFENDTKTKTKKKKALWKTIGHSVVTVCRYMGVGAAMTTSAFSTAFPPNDPFYYHTSTSPTGQYHFSSYYY